METITLQVPDPVYRDFQEFAKRTDRQPEELIREAMENYRAEKIIGLKDTGKKTHSLLDHEPLDLGEILKPWSSRAELLEDFFDRD